MSRASIRHPAFVPITRDNCITMVVFLRCVLVKSKRCFSVFFSLPSRPESMRRFGTVKPCTSKPSAMSRVGQNSSFCDRPNENPSTAMDGLVKNLQNRLNLAQKTQRKAVGVAPATPQPVQAVVSHRKVLPKALTENQETDTIIRRMLKDDLDPSEVVLTLQRLATADKYPSRRTLVGVAGACAAKGHIDGVQAVSDVCEVAFPAEVIWQMYYRHYEAEAHWKRGNCEQALKIFQDLFEMHTLQRRKIINMSNFLIRHVINNGMSELYPKLLTFAEFCLSHQEAVPAANLWRAAFLSELYEANCLANELLTRHADSVLPIVKGKVPAILKDAHDLKQLEILQRLMQLVLNYELTEDYPAVFGAYVDHVCDANDVTLALGAFKYISKYSIIISSESMQKLGTLLALHKKKLPSFLMPQMAKDTKNCETKSSDFKF